jgi:hypothetical protein
VRLSLSLSLSLSFFSLSLSLSLSLTHPLAVCSTPSLQAASNPYLLDGRSGGDSEAYFSRSSVGISWSSMHIDALREGSISWARIPADAWVHVHLETQYAFSAAMTLFARSGGSDFMQGNIADLYIWNKPLTTYQVASPFDLNAPTQSLAKS